MAEMRPMPMTIEEMRKLVIDLEAGDFHHESRQWRRCFEICQRLEKIAERLDRLTPPVTHVGPRGKR